MTARPAIARDERVLPPARRDWRSPSRRFTLSIESLDGWKTPRATAILRESGAVRWSKTLPHELGPRSALVSNDGNVLLLDEWINILSRHAVMLIGADGRVISDRSGEAVIAALGVPPAQVSAQARVGVWRSGEPVPERGVALVPAGGRVLAISLKDGLLTVRR